MVVQTGATQAAVMHPHLAVVETAHGLGLRAVLPIRAGERLLHAPRSSQIDGADASDLASMLLAERARGAASPHAAWVASLPRDVAFSAAGCDDETAAALCAIAGGGAGGCAYVRAVNGLGSGGGGDERWARSFVSANALRVGTGRLRLAPLFTLLNHAEGSARPTEHADGSLTLESESDLARGADVCIDYGHGAAGGAGVLHRYGFFPPAAETEYVVFAERSGDAALEALRGRLELRDGVTLRSSSTAAMAEALELASLLPVLDARARAALARHLDRRGDRGGRGGGDDDGASSSSSSAASKAPSSSRSSSLGFGSLFAAEADRDRAYAWVLRRTPQLRARGRAHCRATLAAALINSHAHAATPTATRGAAVAALRAHCESYRRSREALLEATAAAAA